MADKAFLDRLDDAARKLLLSVARPVAFDKGARLVRHGEPSRGAYVLKSGAAEATVVLPGGETLTVAKLGAGSVFGEMALIERGTCTATVTAAAKIEGWFIERDDFRVLVAQRDKAALAVQHTLTLILSEKLRALNAKVLQVPAPEDKPAEKAEKGDPLASVKRLKKTSFDFRPFLPHLPVFEGFDQAEIDEIVSVSSVLELPKGHAVFTPGQPSDAAFIVLRGAVEVVAVNGKTERRMAVLGPGQLVGHMSLLEGARHGSLARAREAAVLLEVPRKAFEVIYFGTSAAATKLHRAIQRNLLGSLGQTNRHLTRLISLARVRGAGREGDLLETALSGQIVAGE